MTNAVKYTENNDENDDVTLYIEVSDTGIGIREEDIEKLFNPFRRLDERKNRNIEGTGPGIPITHNLLLMMGSKLEVKSVYGQGSSFSFYLHQKRIGQEKNRSF